MPDTGSEQLLWLMIAELRPWALETDLPYS